MFDQDRKEMLVYNFKAISDQCSYFIPPETTTKLKLSRVFRAYKMGTLLNKDSMYTVSLL